jgi:GntP family gluconate:H+ symporter
MNVSLAALTVRRFRLPDLPIAVWMLLGALVVAIAGGLEAPRILSVFNTGWGRSLGDFALILLPSFILASALSRHTATGAAAAATAMGPVAAAGMVCPDTAYAALAPIARGRRLQLAFGGYSGFKLLFPAGPLLVATGLGIDGMKALGFGALLCLPVWATGLLWARRLSPPEPDGPTPHTAVPDSPAGSFAPFAVLVGLILMGMTFDLGPWPIVDFLTRPPGALASAALLALTGLPAEQRRECLDTGIRRTGSLLFLIGAASALGAVLVVVVPIADPVRVASGVTGLLTIVGLPAMFKLVQGSSMATFAAVTPLVAPFLATGDLPPDAMVLAVCVGSLIAVLPNDSFYWLVRQDAFASRTEREALIAIAGGTVLQGLVGIAGLILLHSLDVLG